MSAAHVEIRTDRVVLRKWRHDEAERLLDIRRRPEVTRWLGDPTPWTDLQQAHEYIEEALGHGTEAVPGRLAIVAAGGGQPIGDVSLKPLPRSQDQEIEIGWTLHPDHVGQGWATEAAAALLAHGFAHGLERVWAVMWPDNHASAAVATRIGMTDLGVRPDPWYGTPEDPDSRMFRADAAPGSGTTG